MIPDYTATRENIKGIGVFIKEHLGEIAEADGSFAPSITCALINTRAWESIGHLKKTGLISPEEAGTLASLARDSGVKTEIVHLSGPMRNTDSTESMGEGPHKNVVNDDSSECRCEGGYV